jgi:hypothetical protein
MNAKNWTAEVPDTTDMTRPVRCTHCGGTYDNGVVAKVRAGVSAYWTAPCCGTPVDDRGETASAWKSMEHYVRLDRS